MPQSFDEASIEFYYEEESDPEEPDVYTYDWWWDVTNWNSPPTFHACSSGPCSSTGYSSVTATSYVNDNQGYDEQQESCVY
ncbi:MAG: hypothetical protein WCC14_00945 [Acidobacteriaceae bacterium]